MSTTPTTVTIDVTDAANINGAHLEPGSYISPQLIEVGDIEAASVTLYRLASVTPQYGYRGDAADELLGWSVYAETAAARLPIFIPVGAPVVTVGAGDHVTVDTLRVGDEVFRPAAEDWHTITAIGVLPAGTRVIEFDEGGELIAAAGDLIARRDPARILGVDEHNGRPALVAAVGNLVHYLPNHDAVAVVEVAEALRGRPAAIRELVALNTGASA